MKKEESEGTVFSSMVIHSFIYSPEHSLEEGYKCILTTLCLPDIMLQFSHMLSDIK